MMRVPSFAIRAPWRVPRTRPKAPVQSRRSRRDPLDEALTADRREALSLSARQAAALRYLVSGGRWFLQVRRSPR